MRYFILALFLSTSLTFGQSVPKKIDSLMKAASKADDSTRLRIYNKVGFYYIFNDLSTAQNLLKLGISESRVAKIPFCEAELTNTYGIYYDVSGNSDSARYYFEKALGLSEKHGYNIITVMVINNLGMFHWNNGNYQEALDYFFQALEMNRDNISDKGNGVYLNNIGLIYQEMGQSAKALQYHEEALAIRMKHKALSEIATSLSNIAVVLGSMGRYSEAEEKFHAAITTAKEANELGKYYDALSGLSDIYVDQKKSKDAIPLLKELLKGRNENNIDRRSNLTAISHLISANNDLGRLTEALKYVEMGNDFQREFPRIKNATVAFYENAAETYFRTGNPEKGSEYLQKALAAKEEIFSTENAEAIANLETRFKVADNERSLAESRAELAESELKVEQRNVFIFGFGGLTLFVLIVGYFLYRQQTLKNMQLQRESELKAALAEIEIQNKLQEQRLRISRDLHDNIGAQLAFIISSVDNLKYGIEGESGLSKRLEEISEFTRQTIYELRDTIWAMNKSDITVEDLQARISNFIENAKKAHRINFHLEIEDGSTSGVYFNSIQGMNIYRVIQEAVNNALKHARASEIKIGFLMPENEIHIFIQDDGKGLENTGAVTGNGLANMKKRARDLRGKIQFSTPKDGGTRILLTVPLRNSAR